MSTKHSLLKNPPILRIARALKARSEIEGGFKSLAKAITTVYRNNLQDPRAHPSGRDIVDRRKLKRLTVDDRSVVLNLHEWEALDLYLEPFNEGPSRHPMFERPDILRAFSRAIQATFLIGARRDEESAALSHWDVMAMASVQRGVNRYSTSVQFDIQDVILRDEPTNARSVSHQKWARLTRVDGPSLVGVGSPKSCHATEKMLAMMFRAPPYAKPADRPSDLPFAFVWKPNTGSTFGLSVEQARVIHRKTAQDVADDKGWGLMLDRENGFLSEAPRDKIKIRSYGIVAAQRRRRGQVWIVLAGLTGPATYACAVAIDSIRSTLPEGRPGRDGPVLWSAVEATIDTRQTFRSGQAPQISTLSLLGEPRLWPAA